MKNRGIRAVRMCAWLELAALAAVVTVGSAWSRATAQTLTGQESGAIEWRNIGPYRGGRVTAVEGVASEPRTFYMGAAGGGVWKTTDAGTTWHNISDGWFNTGSVGAIAVAASDPEVVVVGMGEHCVRDVTVSHGDGVYRSTDGGDTWRHLGLSDTRHIAEVLIDPRDPDSIFVAAQGTPWGPSEARGVYRSSDGGESWTRTLYVDEYTGVNDLAQDPANPRVLYAATWEHRRKPWHGYQMTSGGPGSGLYKSTDGGESWERLQEGFPASVGKFAIAVSPADGDRLYALAEAKPGESGVYVSDDAGASWRHVNGDHVVTERAAYYMHIVADPQDRDTVYVLNAPFLKSIDGGKTFSRIAVPHGDNHDLWIHPEHADWMIEANDGGANVSYNGGASWSTQGNQPTAQFYRVNADNEFPYNLYGGQQDNTTVKIRSRSFGPVISVRDWYPVGGGESAHVAFDPDDPRLVYAGNYQGQITVFDDDTGIARDIRRYPLAAAYRPPDQYPYRYNWNAPIVVSRHDPSIVYHGAQMVLRSTDAGQSWVEASPDLTRDEEQKQGVVDGEFTFEGTAGAMYNTIFYIAESPHAAGELWVGTDDGLLHLTRDGGENWTAITPRRIGEAQINMIELSPHRPGKAYIVVTRYKFDDFTPYVYRTEDYGRSWERIVDGIPDDQWMRVVREDPAREGLLYAGTQTSAFVSFDDGDHWQSLQLNLPHVPVTDLKVHAGDLLAATEGRAFWILDDLSVLRQLDDDNEAGVVHLYTPRDTARVNVRTFGRAGTGGENPPTGTTIYYRLPAVPDDGEREVRLEILDAGGAVIRRFSSDDDALAVAEGLHRLVWDWHVTDVGQATDFADFRGPLSYRVRPGAYAVRLTVGATTMTREFAVLADPRVDVSTEGYAEKERLLETVYGQARTLRRHVAALRSIRTRAANVVDLLGESAAASIAPLHEALESRIDAWLADVIEEHDEHFVDAQHSATRLDVSLLEVMLFADLMDPPLTQGLRERADDVQRRWRTRDREYVEIVDGELAVLNEAISGMALPAISAQPDGE